MTRAKWRQRTSWDVVCARQAGRKKWNEQRRRFAGQRRDMVFELLVEYGFDTWGVLSRIAREIGCHRSTIMRDRRAIWRSMLGY
jgi:hypothetical protein